MKTAEKAAAQPAKAKSIWIDVRSPEKFKEGRLKDAVNILIDPIGERIASVSPDKSAPANLYIISIFGGYKSRQHSAEPQKKRYNARLPLTRLFENSLCSIPSKNTNSPPRFYWV